MNNKLERKLGLGAVISIAIGATVGSGIFSTISEVADISQSGIILIFAFLIGGLLQIPSNFCYAELSSAYPEDGGFYVYLREAGAKNLAFFCGWAAFWLIEPPSISLMAIALSNYLSYLIPLNPYLLRIIPALCILLFTYLNIRSVEGGCKVQVLLTVIKIIPFVLIIGIGIFFFKPEIFNSGAASTISGGNFDTSWIFILLAAVASTTFSYDGLYAPSYLTGEIKNPRKNMPIAFVVSTSVVVLLYVLLSVVSCGLISCQDLAASSAPISDVAGCLPFIGDYAGFIVAVIAIVVITGTISTATIYMPRIEYAMARDGYFFKSFAKIHKKYKTPYVSILLNGLLAIVLTFVGDLSILVSIIACISLVRNFATFASIFFLRRKDDYSPSYRCPCGFLFPIMSCSLTLVLIVGIYLNSPLECSFVFLFLLITGSIAFYIWNKLKING